MSRYKMYHIWVVTKKRSKYYLFFIHWYIALNMILFLCHHSVRYFLLAFYDILWNIFTWPSVRFSQLCSHAILLCWILSHAILLDIFSYPSVRFNRLIVNSTPEYVLEYIKNILKNSRKCFDILQIVGSYKSWILDTWQRIIKGFNNV